MKPHVGWLLFAALCFPLASQARAADLDPEEVNRAIDMAIKFIMREQANDGSWSSHAVYDTTGLCTLALLNAGVPADDPHIRRALAYLRKTKLSTTYAVALRVMALCAAEPQRDLRQIVDDARWLQEKQIRRPGHSGMWSYPSGGGDNSNTQFALLALYEAERTLQQFELPSPVKKETWTLSLSHWTNSQNGDGSWGYMPGSRGYGSMTCAGIASVVICSDRLSSGAATVNGDEVRCCGQPEPSDHVQRGLEWLSRNFSVDTNPGYRGGPWRLYFLYGLERVGRMTAVRKIGGHDWYREGTEALVREQDKLAGFWLGTGAVENQPHIGTSLALLFLSKGRRPVLLGKLKHDGGANDWNHHPNDAYNLTRYVEQKWKRDLTWQVVEGRHATVDDLLQSPVIFFNYERPLDFTPDQIKEFRSYVDRGGVIFVDSCCEDRADVEPSFKRFVDQLFPEPEIQLRQLDNSHEVWFFEEAPKSLSLYAGTMYGVNVGCRTSVFYCRNRLSCLWELAHSGRDAGFSAAVKQRVDAALALGVNVLAYATNRELRFKYEIPESSVPDQEATLERAKVVIAKLRHKGGWNTAPGALISLQRELGKELGVLVPTDQREVNINSDKLFDYHIVFMHGRNAFELSAEERQNLKKFAEHGGLILADAVCASEAFARSFRHEMALIFPEHPLERIPPDHRMFTSFYGGFDLHTVKRREPPKQRGPGPVHAVVRDVPPDLDGVKIDDRYAVVFSQYDLSCALESHEAVQCVGYTRTDAARIGVNVVVYAMSE